MSTDILAADITENEILSENVIDTLVRTKTKQMTFGGTKPSVGAVVREVIKELPASSQLKGLLEDLLKALSYSDKDREAIFIDAKRANEALGVELIRLSNARWAEYLKQSSTPVEERK